MNDQLRGFVEFVRQQRFRSANTLAPIYGGGITPAIKRDRASVEELATYYGERHNLDPADLLRGVREHYPEVFLW
jgi:hypothetical protein